jgi:hypothetical protein
MTAVDVRITRPVPAPPQPLTPAASEPANVVIVDDVDTLTAGAVPGCGDDNPYN